MDKYQKCNVPLCYNDMTGKTYVCDDCYGGKEGVGNNTSSMYATDTRAYIKSGAFIPTHDKRHGPHQPCPVKDCKGTEYAPDRCSHSSYKINKCQFADCLKPVHNRLWCDECARKHNDAFDKWKEDGSPTYVGADLNDVAHYNKLWKEKQEALAIPPIKCSCCDRDRVRGYKECADTHYGIVRKSCMILGCDTPITGDTHRCDKHQKDWGTQVMNYREIGKQYETEDQYQKSKEQGTKMATLNVKVNIDESQLKALGKRVEAITNKLQLTVEKANAVALLGTHTTKGKTLDDLVKEIQTPPTEEERKAIEEVQRLYQPEFAFNVPFEGMPQLTQEEIELRRQASRERLAYVTSPIGARNNTPIGRAQSNIPAGATVSIDMATGQVTPASGPAYMSVGYSMGAHGGVTLANLTPEKIKQIQDTIDKQHTNKNLDECDDSPNTDIATDDTTTQEATMATESINTVTVLMADAKDAGWRIAGRQFTKATKEPFIALLCRGLGDESQAMRAKVGAFLNTEIGSALFQSTLSLGLSMMPDSTGNVPKEMARELRTEAMASAGDQVADLLMGPLREVASTYLKGVSEVQQLEAQSVSTVKVNIPVQVNEEVKR